MTIQSDKIIEISKHLNNAHKALEIVSQSLLIATTELLALTKEIGKPILTIIDKEE